MSEANIELDKILDFKSIEERWSKEWLRNDLFRAGQDLTKKPFVIMMPPPNVTGALHNGHALFVTLQDILARFNRMIGRDVLWLPGTDHAGIATQTVVERELKIKEGLSRFSLGREKFLERVFEWKDKHGDQIIEQLKRLGASADWSRLRFTMDEQCNKAVRAAFVRLWEEGLIFRGERLISYDPVSKTALSDEEVEHVEKDGELCYFSYPFKDGSGEIMVATTRLETMLGDTAVAVNPKDERYKNLIGKELIHPFLKERQLVVIGDDYVDQEFGSGAVKITPAHDPNDFAIGERHKLLAISIFDDEGRINANGGRFRGLDRYEARKMIKKELMDLGFFKKAEKIRHSVAISQRSYAEIEPMLSRQYFVNAKSLAENARKAVDEGKVRLTPSFYKKVWDHFLGNIKDWCISRQLWWGHRIPVYYHIDTMKKAITNHHQREGLSCYQAFLSGKSDRVILQKALMELEEPIIKSFSHALLKEPPDEEYIQEEDVLDTWFSSGLWPFSTLGWPDRTSDLARYYPSDVMETGSDILFFWVARMVMFGIHFMKEPPFKDVFLHAIVRDAHGQKMSKSLGNAIDPLDVIDGISLEDLLEKTKTYPVPKDKLPKVLSGLKKDFPKGIPSAGSDGLRLSLAIFSGQGSDVRFDIPRVMGFRAFLNKIWNAARFSLMNIENEKIMPFEDAYKKASIVDRYIISRLNRCIAKTESSIREFHFSEAALAIYHFFWDEFCDHYIEMAKVALNSGDPEEARVTKAMLIYILDMSVRMIHPFCPFVSEEIWQSLPIFEGEEKRKGFCATAAFPKLEKRFIDEKAEECLELVISIVSMVRNARQSSNIAANIALPVKLFAKDEETKKILLTHKKLIKYLARASDIDIGLRALEKIEEQAVINSSTLVDVVIDLKGSLDSKKELIRLEQALKKIEAQLQALKSRLSDISFITKAPKEVVDQHKNELSALLERKTQLELARDAHR